MKLEDLTKEELIKLFQNQLFYPPTEKDMLRARWEIVSGEARRIMAQANEESQKWIGDNTIAGYKRWRDAQELFDKGLRLSDKANALFKEMQEAKSE